MVEFKEEKGTIYEIIIPKEEWEKIKDLKNYELQIEDDKLCIRMQNSITGCAEIIEKIDNIVLHGLTCKNGVYTASKIINTKIVKAIEEISIEKGLQVLRSSGNWARDIETKDLITYIDNLGNTDIIFRIVDASGKIKKELSVKYSEIRGYEEDVIHYKYRSYNKKYKIFKDFDLRLNGNNYERLLICIHLNPKDIKREDIQKEFILETNPPIDYDRFTKVFDLEIGQTGKIMEITAPYGIIIESIFLNVMSFWNEINDLLITRTNMIRNLDIKNFKSIKEIKIGCKKKNIFIGKPNVGKSNILEAIGIFSSPYGRLQDFIRSENITDLFFNRDISETIEISTDYIYCKIANIIEKEKGEHIIGNMIDIKIEDKEKFFYKFEYDYNGIERLTSSKTNYYSPFKFYKFDLHDKFQKYEQNFLLPPDGKNLLSILSINKKLRESVVNIFNEFGLKVVLRIQEEKIEVQKEVEGLIIPIPYKLISDTLQRVVFYLAVIETNNDSIIILEEPESNAFPFYTKMLAEIIALDKYNQYFISTHNPYFLLSILEKTPIDDIGIILTYFENGQTKIKNISDQDLSKILDLGSSIFFNLEKFYESLD